MHYNYDYCGSPLLKHSLSPQMSKSQMERNYYNKSMNSNQEISPLTRKIQLKEMRQKILDVEKMIKNRDRQYLSPSMLRGSVGTNNPEPKYTKQTHLNIPFDKDNGKARFSKQQLRASWNDHLLNMFDDKQDLKFDEKKNGVSSIKNIGLKSNQIGQRVARHQRRNKINEENSQISTPFTLKNQDDGVNHSYRISKLQNTNGNYDYLKNRTAQEIKPQTSSQSQNYDKIRIHINRSIEVLDMIKNDTALKTKQQKKSGLFDRSKPSKILNGFEFGPVLGKGKFGMVYLSRHIDTGFIAAIKLIDKNKIKEFNLVNQLAKEIKLHNCLDHPTIVKFYGFFEEKNQIYLVLEYLNGGTLFDHLNKVGFLGIKEAVDYLRDVISAVSYLHERSIAHRDIKPENIVISTEGLGKLCDFGWSSLVDSVRNTYCGTLDYASPQILQRKDYGLSVDIWSIGILAYEMLMGKAPFQDKNRNLVKQRILNVDKIQFNYAQNVPQQAKEFIEALVQKDASKRPKVGELLNFKLFTNYGSRANKKSN